MWKKGTVDQTANRECLRKRGLLSRSFPSSPRSEYTIRAKLKNASPFFSPRHPTPERQFKKKRSGITCGSTMKAAETLRFDNDKTILKKRTTF